MIALASGLLAAAALFAERAITNARSHRVAAELGVSAPVRRPPPPWIVIGVPAFLAVALVLGPAAAAIGAVFVVVGRRGWQRRRVARQRRAAAEQLPDAVSAAAAALRAGLSLPQSLSYAADESEQPLAAELEGIVRGVELGTPVGEALASWADRHGTDDARLLAGVLDLHRRSGGDLPAVLDELAATLRERRSAQREVRALTAQARLSGFILGLLPIGFFAFLLLTSRREMLEAIATPLGRAAVLGGLGLEVVAFVWIRRLLEVR